MIFYALKVSFLNDICESRDTAILRQAWLQEPTQEQIDATVERWIANMAQACEERRSIYKVKEILSVRIIDFIVEIEYGV